MGFVVSSLEPVLEIPDISTLLSKITKNTMFDETRSPEIESFRRLPLLSTGSCRERSPKKGMVIPNWPRHYVRDFDNMDTIRYMTKDI